VVSGVIIALVLIAGGVYLWVTRIQPVNPQLLEFITL
jgi:hypothetical protein